MNIDVNPKTALVTCPLAVAMSVGSAKKARYVSELPSRIISRDIGDLLSRRRFRRAERAGDDALGDIAHATALAHRGALEERERLLLLHAELVGQDAFRAVDQLARLQLLAERVDLPAERLQLAEPPDRHLDCGYQIALLVRLDEIGERAAVARLLDDFPLAERSE